MTLSIRFPDREFEDWEALHALVHSSYAYMDARIDPPSSLHGMSVDDLAEKARAEWLLTACDGDELIACAFVHLRADHAYIGKVAVRPHRQGQGIFARCLDVIERELRARGITELQLQVRIELTEVQIAYQHLDFVEIGQTSHMGYERPTSVTMRKMI